MIQMDATPYGKTALHFVLVDGDAPESKEISLQPKFSQ